MYMDLTFKHGLVFMLSNRCQHNVLDCVLSQVAIIPHMLDSVVSQVTLAFERLMLKLK